MFAETPPSARRGRRFVLVASVAAHIPLLGVLMLMPRGAEPVLDPILPIQLVFTAPPPSIPETMRPPEPPRPIKMPKPKPRPEHRDEPPPPPTRAEPPAPKPVTPEPVAPPAAKVEPPRPRPIVRTGLLDEPPAGPAIAASTSSRSLVVASGFDGADTAAAAPSPRAARGAQGIVRESGFGEEVAAVRRKREPGPGIGALDTEVEILSKPKPSYTDDARALRIEGDVVLDVTFQATGGVLVLGVAQGLGHGLDEAAIEAAKKIRFNPAKRDGVAVDHTAKLRVVFRLA